MLISACSGARSEPAEVREARGILLDVQSRDLTQAETVTLRSDAGSVQVFRVSGEVARDPQHPNPASHLRQHMTVADPLVIRYLSEPEGPLAIQIIDAGSLR